MIHLTLCDTFWVKFVNTTPISSDHLARPEGVGELVAL